MCGLLESSHRGPSSIRAALAAQARVRERCGESRVLTLCPTLRDSTRRPRTESLEGAEFPLTDGEGLKQPPDVSLKGPTRELQVSGEKTDFWDGCGETALGGPLRALTPDDRGELQPGEVKQACLLPPGARLYASG